jgi:Transposase IS116/IS110/IS902 family
MDRPAGRARAGPPQLRATPADPGAAQPHPLPKTVIQERPARPSGWRNCWRTPAPSSPNSKRPWSAAWAPPWAADGRDAGPHRRRRRHHRAARAPRSAASPPPTPRSWSCCRPSPGATGAPPRSSWPRPAETCASPRSAAHLASWAGLCPGTGEAAGKHHSGRTRKGSKWLRGALVEAAHAAARTTDTYLAAQYRRLGGRRNDKRAAVAVAHSILVIAYHSWTAASAMPNSAVTGCSSVSPPARMPSGWSASWSGWAPRSPWSPPTPLKAGNTILTQGGTATSGIFDSVEVSLRGRRAGVKMGRVARRRRCMLGRLRP